MFLRILDTNRTSLILVSSRTRPNSVSIGPTAALPARRRVQPAARSEDLTHIRLAVTVMISLGGCSWMGEWRGSRHGVARSLARLACDPENGSCDCTLLQDGGKRRPRVYSPGNISLVSADEHGGIGTRTVCQSRNRVDEYQHSNANEIVLLVHT